MNYSKYETEIPDITERKGYGFGWAPDNFQHMDAYGYVDVQ